MKNKIFFFLLSLVMSFTLMAKEFVFDVLIINGSVQNVAKSSVLKVGEKLVKGDQVDVKEGSYLALLHKTGITVEVKKAGKYTVDALEKTISVSSSYSKEYTDFVIKSFKKKNIQKNYNSMGAVTRGVTTGDKLFLRTPNKTSFAKGQDIILRWTKVTNAKGYKVEVFDNFQTVVYKKDVEETTHTIPFAEFGGQSRYTVKVSVQSASSNNDKLILSLYDASTSFEDLNTFSGKKAIDFLIKAKYYEKKGLLLHAQEFYLKAKDIEPNSVYKFQYNQFLHRHVKGI